MTSVKKLKGRPYLHVETKDEANSNSNNTNCLELSLIVRAAYADFVSKSKKTILSEIV